MCDIRGPANENQRSKPPTGMEPGSTLTLSLTRQALVEYCESTTTRVEWQSERNAGQSPLFKTNNLKTFVQINWGLSQCWISRWFFKK